MKVVCIVAHPDDETVFAAGTLALLARAGAEVHILWATRGEGGEAGEPPICKREDLGIVREAEARRAAKAIGASGMDFLGFRDPDVGLDGALFAYAEDSQEVARAIAGTLRVLHPDLVMTHGSNGEYGHPAHRMTHQAVTSAMADFPEFALVTFSAFFPGHPRPRIANKDDAADIVVDVSGAFEQKRAAFECHQTQHALFVRRPSAEAGHPVSLTDVILRAESFHCVKNPAAMKDIFQKIPAAWLTR